MPLQCKTSWTYHQASTAGEMIPAQPLGDCHPSDSLSIARACRPRNDETRLESPGKIRDHYVMPIIPDLAQAIPQSSAEWVLILCQPVPPDGNCKCACQACGYRNNTRVHHNHPRISAACHAMYVWVYQLKCACLIINNTNIYSICTMDGACTYTMSRHSAEIYSPQSLTAPLLTCNALNYCPRPYRGPEEPPEGLQEAKECNQ